MLLSPDLVIVVGLLGLITVLVVFVSGRLPDATTLGSGVGIGFDVGIALGVAVGGLVAAVAGAGLGLLASYRATEPVTRRTATLLARLLYRSAAFVVGLLGGYLVAAGSEIPLVRVPALMLSVGAGVVAGGFVGTYGVLLPALLIGTAVALPFGLGIKRLSALPPPSLAGALFGELRTSLSSHLTGQSQDPGHTRAARELLLLDDHPWRRQILAADLEARGYSVDLEHLSLEEQPRAHDAEAVLIAIPSTSGDPGGEPPWSRAAMVAARVQMKPAARVVYLSSEPELRHEGHPLSATMVFWSGDPRDDLGAVVDAALSRSPSPTLMARVDAAIRRAARTTMLARAAVRQRSQRAQEDLPGVEQYHDESGQIQGVDSAMLARVDGVYAGLRCALPLIALRAALLRCDRPDRWILTVVSDAPIDDAIRDNLRPVLSGPHERVVQLEAAAWDGYSNTMMRGALRLVNPNGIPFPEVTAEVSTGARLSTEGRFDEALPYLELALRRNPRSSWAWIELGHLRRLSRDFGRALIAYLMATELGEELGPEFAEECARRLGVAIHPPSLENRWTV